MAFVTIEPLSDVSETILTRYWDQFEKTIENTIHGVWGIDKNDIIVSPLKNATLPVKTRAKTRGVRPDYIIRITTSDEFPLAHTAPARSIIVGALCSLPIKIKAEIWFLRLEDWGVTFGPYTST